MMIKSSVQTKNIDDCDESKRLTDCLGKYKQEFAGYTSVDYLLSINAFSVRTRNCLIQKKCRTISDIISNFNNWKELQSIRGLGGKSISEIRLVLERTKLFKNYDNGENEDEVDNTLQDMLFYFSKLYDFLNYSEIDFILKYYVSHNIEPFLYILYKYLIQSSERDITIYCRYYGLYDGEPVILEGLADEVDLSVNRIKQIVSSSLKIDENFLNKVSSDQIFKCIYLDELSNEYIRYKEEQNIPFGFTQFAALLTLVGTFKEQDIMGHTCLINNKMTFGFDCKTFVKKCSRMSQSRRNTIRVPIINFMEGCKDKHCVELAKGIASRYLGIQSTTKNELIFKQTYIDYENEIYWILFNNAEPMLLNDIMTLLSERHPDYKLKDNPRVREEMYSRGRITSIPIEGESYKLYIADKSKAGLSLDRWWEEGQYCDYNDEEDEGNYDE